MLSFPDCNNLLPLTPFFTRLCFSVSVRHLFLNILFHSYKIQKWMYCVSFKTCYFLFSRSLHQNEYERKCKNWYIFIFFFPYLTIFCFNDAHHISLFNNKVMQQWSFHSWWLPSFLMAELWKAHPETRLKLRRGRLCVCSLWLPDMWGRLHGLWLHFMRFLTKSWSWELVIGVWVTF